LLVRTPDLLDELAVDTPYLESTSQATLTGTRSGAGVASAVAAMEELWPGGYRRQYVRSQNNAEWLADALEKRGYQVADPTLPLVAADVPRSTFDALRAKGLADFADRDGRVAGRLHAPRHPRDVGFLYRGSGPARGSRERSVVSDD